MKTFFEAYGERLEQNQTDLINFAKEVRIKHPEIEIYRSSVDGFISGLVFFKSEDKNEIHFHEVPYRWSGCGHGEFYDSHYGKEHNRMPFNIDDLISTFRPITRIKYSQPNNFFKSKADFLKKYSFYVKLEFIEDNPDSITEYTIGELIPVHINKARNDEYFYNWSSDSRKYFRGDKIPEELKRAYKNPVAKSNYK